MCPSYHLTVASFVFECKISFPRFQYFFVDGCSAGSCDFSIFIEKLNLGPSTPSSCQETLAFVSDLSHSYLLFFFVNIAKSLEILFFISKNLLFISSTLLFFLLYLHSNLYYFLLSASFGFTLLFFPHFS